ncbi:MAG: Cerebroside-sulfatase [Spirochaetaceae bacterium]|nr:MAG: Cerebroside-sulfatase [Spirochaetaceae bacterium]
MKNKPNIILINCDDLGWGDPGCYGHPLHATPHIDRLAEEGVRFTDFYMASPVCSPSRGAMMTGCYPARIGFSEFEGKWVLFPGQPVGLNPEEQTIAGLLKEAGYATKLIGKWHCGDQSEFLPTAHGFDEFYGLPYSNDMARQAGLEHQWPPLPLMRNGEVVEQQPDQRSITSRYVEESVRYLRDHRDGPFFLYFAHMHVHLPHYVPERFVAESKNGVYGAAVANIDWATGVLLAELKDLGIDEDTIVIFTSDNGSRNDFGASNGPLRGTKGTTWEGGQRVPCIVRRPGTVPAGRTCSEIATAMDFLPTFAQIAGVSPRTERPIDGKDILPLMLAEPEAQSPHEAFFYHHRNRLEAVRTRRWKLHVRKDDSEMLELYDLIADPGETTDVAAAEPAVVAELSALLDGFRTELGDTATGAPGSGCRPIGRVPVGRPLTEYDPTHPYFMAEYDLADRG